MLIKFVAQANAANHYTMPRVYATKNEQFKFNLVCVSTGY